MKVKEYLQNKKPSDQVTFVVVKAEKDEHSPFYHNAYTTTPIMYVQDVVNSKINDYIILNDKQNPIDWLSGAKWNNWFKADHLMCMLVISQEEFYKMYSKEQADGMELFIEKEIRKNEEKENAINNASDFKEILQLSGMTMKLFSDYFNIPYRTVQNWSSGERQPPEYVLELIKDKLK